MTTQEAQHLQHELKSRLGASRVDVEQVDAGRFRFGIVSPGFSGMPHLQRQDEVWEVVDSVLPRPATLDISLIIAFAPDELDP